MRILAAALLLVSAQAFACPDLTGSFTCSTPNGTEVLNLSQADKNGVTVYNYNGSDIPADNQAYPMQDDQSIKEATFRAWCEGASLKGNLIGKYYNAGSYFGDLNMTLDLSLQGNDLLNVTGGTLVTTSGQTYPLDNSVVCTRN